MYDLPESAQLILGAFALADVHTLSPGEVSKMAGGALPVEELEAAFASLEAAGHAELMEDGGYRLTRTGIEISLKMQEALQRRSGD